MKLILASQSPQRKRILKQMGIRFKAIPSHTSEDAGNLKKPHAMAKKIALDKALEIAKLNPNEWILACDTFVVLQNGKISLKPKNRQEAKETIKLYRNAYCNVYSGLALINKKLNKKFVQYAKTTLYFDYFSDKQIEEYLDSGEWKDRSGSMTIEGKGGKWIKKIKGDYWNVVGLPVDLLKEIIKTIERN